MSYGNWYSGGYIKIIKDNPSTSTDNSVSNEDIAAIGKTDDLNKNECIPGKETHIKKNAICATPALATSLIDIVLTNKEKTGDLAIDYQVAVIKTNTENDCKSTDCTSESLALHNNADVLDKQELKKNKEQNFLPLGPAGANEQDRKEWLSNGDIDDNIMHFYSEKWNSDHAKTYYHMPFHMCGFMKTKDEASDKEQLHQEFPTKLRSLNLFTDVVEKGYSYFGCVLNTDTYDNGGKHWVSLFVDIINKKFEYFDSVGRPPFKDVIMWMEKSKGEMPNSSEWEITPCNRHQHQRENWDCGLFACFYIIKRVQGVPYDAFHSSNAPLTDDFMGHDLRQRFFRLKDF